MIVSFACADTEALFNERPNRDKPVARPLQRAALAKLLMLDAAHDISDLRNPPGNRLETLKGDRAGQHSIRINGQYRICLIWRNGNAHEVEITDYH